MLTYNRYVELINDALRSFPYPAQPRGLYEPISYAIDCGGKRLRPVLALSVCESLGAEASTAINQAVGIEMYHNFTLLHDDVMDRAEVRRGRPAVHVKYGEASAILSGDAMLTLAGITMGKGCTETLLPRVLHLFNTTAMEVYEGQQYDMDFESRMDVTIDEYLDMIRLKTSVLLGCACKLGAIMAGADEDVCDAFYRYGEQLGMAFQLRDDLLDTYGDPATFGKEIGGDICNDKKTWLLITALSEDTTGEVKREITAPSDKTQKIANVKKVYDRLNLPERCSLLIDCYISEAIDALERTGISEKDKEFFTSLAHKSTTRVS